MTRKPKLVSWGKLRKGVERKWADCSECYGKLSVTAKFCVHCGATFTSKAEK